MVYVAPSLRLLLLPSASRFLEDEMSVSSFAEEMAARGGLDGGEGIPEDAPRTSGKPLGPYEISSASNFYK